MATKSRLEQAVEKKASELNDAQRELVMSQLSVYKKNAARLTKVEDEMCAVDSMVPTTRDELRKKQSQRSTLAYERNQLTTANSRIASDLFEFMKE